MASPMGMLKLKAQQSLHINAYADALSAFLDAGLVAYLHNAQTLAHTPLHTYAYNSACRS